MKTKLDKKIKNKFFNWWIWASFIMCVGWVHFELDDFIVTKSNNRSEQQQ